MSWLFPLLPRRAVTLVVDDGPTEATPRLLDRLEAAGHRAVLFVLGCNIAGREAIVVDAIRRGFALGNHSFAHPFFSSLSPGEARDEIAATETLIDDAYRDAGKARPGRWFRFPYLDDGAAGADAMQALLRDMGFARPAVTGPRLGSDAADRLDWPTTLSTRDWALPGEADFRRTLDRAQPGDVIEFHDKPETVDRYTGVLVEMLTKRRLRARVPENRR